MYIAVEILNRSTISDESRFVTKRLVGPIQDPIMKHRIGFYHSSKLPFFCSIVLNRVKPKQCGNPSPNALAHELVSLPIVHRWYMMWISRSCQWDLRWIGQDLWVRMGLPTAGPLTSHTWLACPIWWSWLLLTRQNFSTWLQPLQQSTTVLAVSDSPVEMASASPSLKTSRAFLLRSVPHHVSHRAQFHTTPVIMMIDSCTLCNELLYSPGSWCYIITWADWKRENPSWGLSSCNTWLRLHCPKLCSSADLPPWAWCLGHSGRCKVLQTLGQGPHQEVGPWPWGTHHYWRRRYWRLFGPCGALPLSRGLTWWRPQGELQFQTLYLVWIGNVLKRSWNCNRL